MASNGPTNWPVVPAGSTLRLTNTSAALGSATLTITAFSAGGERGVYDGSLPPTPMTLPLQLASYAIFWFLLAMPDHEGLSGAAGFTFEVLNPDGSVNQTPFTASCTATTKNVTDSGTLNVGVEG